MSHPMLSYIEELDVLEGLNRTVSTLLCRIQQERTINLPRPHEQARSNHVRRLDPRLSAKRWAF